MGEDQSEGRGGDGEHRLVAQKTKSNVTTNLRGQGARARARGGTTSSTCSSCTRGGNEQYVQLVHEGGVGQYVPLVRERDVG